MKQNKAAQAQIASIKRELGDVRRASLIATRKGDFMRVARLNAQAQELSRSLASAEGILPLDLF
jgi:hypothetical protein